MNRRIYIISSNLENFKVKNLNIKNVVKNIISILLSLCLSFYLLKSVESSLRVDPTQSYGKIQNPDS